jgi:hypothetical protein
MTFADKLTELSNQSLERQKRDEVEKKRIELQLKQAEADAQIAAANALLAGIEGVLLAKAAEGAKSHKICRLKYDEDFRYPSGTNNLTLSNIRSVKITHLYQELYKKGLNPKFVYWHDGCGIDSGYDFVIDWP